MPLTMPSGLLGFERFKQWRLISDPNQAPFFWLQVVEDPSLTFLLVPPATIAPTYKPDVPAEDAAALGLADPADAVLLNIVTLNANAPATVNLKGPIVINRRTLAGKQVIPLNAAEYSVRHPLPAAG